MDQKLDQTKIVLLILCILFPPLAVYIKSGLGLPLVLNLFLTVFGFWLIGIVHAVYMVLYDSTT